MNSSYVEATNALATLLSSKVYSFVRDKLWSLSMDTISKYSNLHFQYATSPCSTQSELDLFQREKDLIFRVYKDSIIQLSASAELLDKMSETSDHNTSHMDDQVPAMVSDIMDLLTMNVTESKTTMDHLIEVREADQQIRTEVPMIAEKLRKIRDLKEQIELVYISKTLN